MKNTKEKIEGILWIICFLWAISLAVHFQSQALNAYLFLLVCVLISFFGFFLCHYKSLSDFRWSILILILLFLVILTMIDFEILFDKEAKEKFLKAKVEWFLTIVSIIGVIGAVWAIIAKIEASRAFKAAQAAQRSIAGIIDFREILVPFGEKAEVPMLPQLVESAKQELIMMLGVPAVGFFDEKLRKESLDFLMDLIKKLGTFTVDDNNVTKISNDVEKITILYFSRDYLIKLLNRNGAHKISEGDSGKLLKTFDLFVSEADKLKKLNLDNIKIVEYSFDIGIRFVISVSKIKDRVFENKALVWVVSNFDDDNPSKFESAGFTTRDINIIENLKQLADDYAKRLPKIITEEEILSMGLTLEEVREKQMKNPVNKITGESNTN